MSYRFSTQYLRALAFSISFLSSITCFSQTTDSIIDNIKEKQKDAISGRIGLTNNGISLVPSFSLGDPAILFDLKFGRKRFTIEPDIRFSLKAKPWSFLFWLRYQAIQKEKFSLRIGAHPGFNFRTVPIIANGIEKDVIETRRFLAGELAPTYAVAKNVRLGMYYLYSRGLDDSAKNTHFMVLNSTFTSVKLFDQVYAVVSPQVYYLNQDALDGFYAVGFISVGKKDFPISLSAIFNKAIDTQILPEKDFVWNVSLVYSFN